MFYTEYVCEIILIITLQFLSIYNNCILHFIYTNVYNQINISSHIYFDCTYLNKMKILLHVYQTLRARTWFIASISLWDIGSNINPGTGGVNSKSRNSFTFIFKLLLNLLIAVLHSL